uniref:NHL repeat-containing protein n=1 Tax=Lotharella oceanica TaxID=641309 RepID=A0A7S2XAL5_9EUKA
MASPRRLSNIDMRIRVFNNSGIVQTICAGRSSTPIVSDRYRDMHCEDEIDPKGDQAVMKTECRRKPTGFAVDQNSGAMFFSDAVRNCLICISPSCPTNPMTLAGGDHSDTGRDGWRDGGGSTALFREPRGLAIGPAGEIYVADSGNHCIRRVVYDKAELQEVVRQQQGEAVAATQMQPAQAYDPASDELRRVLRSKLNWRGGG